MILMSSVDGLDQNEPVTTSYDVDREPDWEQAEDLHTFCTERAFERISAAGARDEWAVVDGQCRSLRVLDVLMADAKRRPQLRTAVLQYLCAQAMEDQHHEEFREEWVLPPRGRHLRSV
jgi:hypothetical protein